MTVGTRPLPFELERSAGNLMRQASKNQVSEYD